MRRPLHFGHLLQVVKREEQYHNIKICSEKCHAMGLTFGVSFYGAARIDALDKTLYKRIEIWCKSCPSKQEFEYLHNFFDRKVPKVANSIFAFVDNVLYEVK